MADTPSSILLLRLQSVGSNTNLWGGYLNTAMQTLERAAKGYQALAVTGDATISWTNYSASNDGAVATLKLTGSLSSAATLTMPGYQHSVLVWNATGAAVTLKCSGGTGISVANGSKALLYCDATDYYQATPNQIGAALTGVTAGTNNTDAVNVAQLAAAIAASVPAGTAGTLLNSVTDTTRGFLRAKMTTQVGSLTTTQVSGLQSLSLSTLNGGGDEQLAIVGSNGYVGGFLDGGYKSTSFTPTQGTAYEVDCSAASLTVSLGGMTSVMLGQSIKLNKYGYYPFCLAGTVNGQTNLITATPGVYELRYSGSSWGWN